ncbi:MAG: MFS transporter [Chitinophagales bacterium]|nr:MFS transporter [Chitinophagales bacterium]
MLKDKVKQIFIEPFKALENKTFAKLYVSQTISLLGDAISWVGLALLAYQIDKENSSKILATALTLRVTAFIIFSPFAGVLADKVDRKKILYMTHFIRMAIICCLPFITAKWHIYLLVFLLNVFNAFFTPTYRAIIPQIIEGKYFREAVGLSTATFQILGILGPGFAGIIAVWFGARDIFFLDGLSFIIAAMLILSIPGAELQKGVSLEAQDSKTTWNDVINGIKFLFGNKTLRFALSIEFISAIAGACILVNSISHVKNNLLLSDKYYGWLMAAFGIGAAVAAFLLGSLDKTKTRSISLVSGALLLGVSISFANYVPYTALIVFWLFAGLGQSLAEMPSETLIAENIESDNQGKVYGSHFAFSHLWWAIAYPIAGYLGTNFPKADFLYGGIATMALGLIAILIFRPSLNMNEKLINR